MTNRERLLEILYEINPDVDYDMEESLIYDGIFDSLEVMTIITEISDQFNIDIDPDDINAENFNSVEMMLKVIEKNQSGKGEE